MKPMEEFRENVVTVSNQTAPAGSVHLGASAAFLNGVGPVGARDNFGGDAFGKIESKKTVDQWIADVTAGDTPLRSIEVGTEDMGTAAGACDGFPCTFFNTLSWRDDTSPLPVGINPRITFERLFGETGSTAERLSRLRQKQSMLDSVLAETNRLKTRLGPADNAILDSYLSNVRQVEQQLERMESRQASIVDTSDAPVGIPDTFDDHVKLSYDLMHLAFQADLTRTFTFLLGHEASTRNYAHIGVPEAHHSISHHANDPEKLDKYAKIALYHLVRIGEFLNQLKDTSDGQGGNLFQHTMLYFGSGMSNGNAHDRNNPPALLVGGANGKMKGNRHIVMNKEPVANLLVGMAQAAGSDITTLGPSTGVVSLA
jgi:hypothetical protein